MHIADGVLSPPVCIATGLLSAGAVAFGLRRLNASLGERVIPYTGMMAALVFAGQMVNFPLFGTAVSGHLMGGVLAAAVLGPWAGCIALTIVLVVQCFLFSDGGLWSLGANVLHMGVVGAIGGAAVYGFLRRVLGQGFRGTIAAAVVASWLSVVAAAALFCLEFQLSWPNEDYNFGRIFTLMVTFHSAIGLGEALITGVVIASIYHQRPALLFGGVAAGPQRVSGGQTLVAGMVLALAVAAFLSPLASSHPDGLEAVAERTEFAEREQASVTGLLEDYSLPALQASWTRAPAWQWVSVAAAGVGGALLVFGLALLLGRCLPPPPAPGWKSVEE